MKTRALSLCRLGVALTGILVTTCPAAQKDVGTPDVRLARSQNHIRVTIDGALFTDYVFTDTSRPYCYPVYGPKQIAMTRGWPMAEVPGEDKDHPHHKGLWFAHGSVNGIDFWSEVKNTGKILHAGFEALESGEGFAVIRSTNHWVGPTGKLVCTDRRSLRFSCNPDGDRVLDFEITLYASEGDVTLGDTKEGTMAIRVAETMRLKPNKAGLGQGHILNSEGIRDGATWGKRANWCDYYDDEAGTAIFDHPSNPRHPTWWHVRDYGLFAANPFGRHDFEQLSDPKAGDLTVKKGSAVSFRYRFLFHAGGEDREHVAAEFNKYAAQP